MALSRLRSPEPDGVWLWFRRSGISGSTDRIVQATYRDPARQELMAVQIFYIEFIHEDQQEDIEDSMKPSPSSR